MRVLQVHNRHRIRGGEDIVVEQELDLLRSGGHAVAPYIVDNPVTVRSSATALARAPWNRSAARTVVDAARKHRADVVHVHNTWFAISPAVFPALTDAGFPVVTTLHNFRSVCMNGLLTRNGVPCDSCVGKGPWAGVQHRCYRGSRALSGVAAATIVVPRTRKVWQDHVDRYIVLDADAVPTLVAGGIPEERISVIPNFVPDPGARATSPSASRQVLYAGRLSEEKGADVLLKAWSIAEPRDLALTFFGDGPLGTVLGGSKVPGIRFAGRVSREELLASMLTARVLVFPSICREAGPVAPIEATACGLPVLISSIVSFASRLTGSGAGQSVAPGDPAALAAALTSLEDGPAIDRMGVCARNLYESSHSPRSTLPVLESVYESAVLQAGNRTVNAVKTQGSLA